MPHDNREDIFKALYNDHDYYLKTVPHGLRFAPDIGKLTKITKNPGFEVTGKSEDLKKIEDTRKSKKFVDTRKSKKFEVTRKSETDRKFEEFVEFQFYKLQDSSARVIQKNWMLLHQRITFAAIKIRLEKLARSNPAQSLRRVNATEAKLFDRITPYRLVLRLAGEEFPPVIVYKIVNTCRNVIIGPGEYRNKADPNGQSAELIGGLGWRVFLKCVAVNPVTDNRALSVRSIDCKSKRREPKKKRKILWIEKKYNF